LTNRKKHTQACKIRHYYGDDELEDDCVDEDIAKQLTEQAIKDGSASTVDVQLNVVAPPSGADVTVGGRKKCKSCGSGTHSRRTHKDCPFKSTTDKNK